MSDEIEAAGALATAGMAAAAIEVASSAEAAHGRCANCATPLEGAFCHACGQRGHLHRSLWHMLEEAMHGILHLDGKIWRTLPALIFRPGKLTRDYIHGHRARYVSPMALFLFATFLMFFVFSFVDYSGPVEVDATPTEVASATREAARDAEKAYRAEVRAGRPATVERRIRDTTAAVARRTEARAKQGDRVITGATTKLDIADLGIFEGGANTGSEVLDAKIDEAVRNPQFFFYKMKNAAYKFSFLLVPLSLPLIWLLFFWNRGVTMYDHTVFSLYSLAFMSLLFITFVIGISAGGIWESAAGFLMFVPPIHWYAQLKGGYGLTRWGALWRTVALLTIALSTVIIFALIIVALGIW